MVKLTEFIFGPFVPFQVIMQAFWGSKKHNFIDSGIPPFTRVPSPHGQRQQPQTTIPQPGSILSGFGVGGEGSKRVRVP